MQSGFTKKAEEALKNSATTAYAYGRERCTDSAS